MLEFKPIDLERNHDLCVQFRADSFLCSFGSAARFYKEDGSGVEEYLQWLRHRMTEIPNSCVHVWQEEQIIGQVEMMRWKNDSSIGYVNLFYLIPEFRGQGFGQQLDQYAAHFFKHLGCHSARLNVSPANGMAMRFYLKHGWIDLGERDDDPEVHYIEKKYGANVQELITIPQLGR
ncbi:MAG: GNAT family N-acetyltransferase [Oscillatoriales cyanobacterium C42_A2020_001]|nr:GNAT family N-acetyltransferase [Leptolyngbyaceae cyanobacterium C42_A2020_001]